MNGRSARAFSRAVRPVVVAGVTGRVFAVLVPLLFYAATSLPWLIVIPPFDAPDEIAHYDHARYIAVMGHLPDRVPSALNDEGWYTSHWPQPPLYYLLQSVVIRASGAEAISPLALILSDPATRAIGPSARRLIVREPGDRRATRALFRARLVSWACGAGLVLALLAALGAAGASDRARLLIVSALLLVPGFGANMTAVNNDALAACLAAAATAVLLRFAARPVAPGLPSWSAAGLLIGLALLSKSTTSLLLPMAAVSALVIARPSWRMATMRLGALALGIAACWSGMWVRNWMVFGDPLALDLAAGLTRFHGAPPSWTLWRPELFLGLSRDLFHGFFAQFGWSGAGPRSDDVWWLYGLLALAAIVLCAIAIVRLAAQGRGTPETVQQARIAAAGLLCHLLVLYGVNAVMYASSGRHLLPALVPALVLVFLGGRTTARALSHEGRRASSLTVPQKMSQKMPQRIAQRMTQRITHRMTAGMTLRLTVRMILSRALPAAMLCLLAAAWISVFVEMTLGFRFGG